MSVAVRLATPWNGPIAALTARTGVAFVSCRVPFVVLLLPEKLLPPVYVAEML